MKIDMPSDEEKKLAISIIKRWSDDSLLMGNERIGNTLKQLHSDLWEIYCLEFADC